MITEIPETFKFEICDDRLTNNVGAMGLAGIAQRFSLLQWMNDTLPSYNSNRAYQPQKYGFTQMANKCMGGANLEDSRAVSEDEGLQKWLKEEGFPSPNTLGEWFRQADWKDESYARKKNREIVTEILRERGCTKVHYDIDAKVHYSDNRSARHTYKGPKGYCPLYVTIPEQKLLWDALFRPGNYVPKQHNGSMTRLLLKECPDFIEHLHVTLDAAGWQVRVVGALLRADEREDERKVKFYIRPAKPSDDPSNRVKGDIVRISEQQWEPWEIVEEDDDGNEVRKEDPRGRELAETTTTISNAKTTHELRLVVVREEEDPDPDQLSMVPVYKYSTVATNDEESTKQEVVEDGYHRRGAAEDVIGESVEDGAADRFPMGSDRANALYLQMNIMTHNMMQYMKDQKLPDDFQSLTPKSLRRRILSVPVRVAESGRYLKLKISRYFSWSELIEPFIRSCWTPAAARAPG